MKVKHNIISYYHKFLKLKVVDLYVDGFKQMRVGKTLWLVILIKLFIVFVILKLFFFSNFIGKHAAKGQEAEFVSSQILPGK